MHFSIALQLALLAFTILTSGLLAILVYRDKRESATNRIFLLLSLVTIFWLFAIVSSSWIEQESYYLLLSRLTIFFAPAQGTLFLLLVHTMPEDHVRMGHQKLLLLIFFTVSVMALTLTPAIFSGVVLSQNGNPTLVPGLLMPVFVAFMSITSMLAFLLLFRKLRLSHGIEHKQFFLMFVGIFLMLGLIIATIMVPVVFLENDSFLPFAPFYVFLFLVMTAIAILRYGLFNIRAFAIEVIVAMLVVVLITEGLTSGSLSQVLLKFFFAALVSLLGVLLVRSAYRELKQKEELAALAASLEKANERLKEIDHQKTEFLSMASHQLRTPLSIIKGYTELLHDGAYGKPHKAMFKIFADIDESNERLVKLVDDFLDITRIEQGRTKFSFAAFDPAALVTNVVNELRQRAEMKHLSVVWQPPSRVLSVDADEDKLRHVIFNFLDNAIKYSDKGTIRVLLGTEDGGLVYRVMDEGVGFDADDGQKFFQKFFRGENVKHTDANGTGIGIYICRIFVEGHTGRVWAKSRGIGTGSEFGFWIPLKQAQGDAAAP